jgi:hypothetical protein
MTENITRCVFFVLESFAVFGAAVTTHLYAAYFKALSLQLCAFEGQFGEQLVSYCVGPFTVSQLCHRSVALPKIAWYL